jgi:coenzyme F420 hydrogenase subunit beta
MREERLRNVQDIAAWRLCMGCGACKWACPNNAISLVNLVEIGIRPFVVEEKCKRCGRCKDVCPGVRLNNNNSLPNVISELTSEWGPVIELYEGYACDEKIRFAGSSGGMTTALALYGIEKSDYAGILHIRTDPNDPLGNVPTFSVNREDLLETTGSRYGPAAPCEAFDLIRRADRPCIFIGKPCDVAALSNARKMDPVLDKNVALTISIFCAGTPSRRGTLKMLRAMGIDNLQSLESINYRGNGWPGDAIAELVGGNQVTMTYEQSWDNILSQHSQLRCRLCPDSSGEFADISCGDPWYRVIEPSEPGSSLVLARSEKGLEFIKKAQKDSYIIIEERTPEVLPQSQSSILNRRRQLWGRLLMMYLFGCCIPKYEGFELHRNWANISFLRQVRCLAGTIRRIISRKWFRPEQIKYENEA